MKFSEINGIKACLVATTIAEYRVLFDPAACAEKFGEEPDQDPEDVETAEHREYQRKLNEAEHAADAAWEKTGKELTQFLARHQAHDLSFGHPIWMKAADQLRWGDDWTMMVFAADVTDQEARDFISALKKRPGIGLFRSGSINTIGGKDLSFDQLRAMVEGDSAMPNIEGETDEQWLARCAMSRAQVQAMTAALTMCNGNISLLLRAGIKQLIDSTPTIEWLVEGVFPLGVISNIIGEPKVGKSTVLTELAGAIATGANSWAGFKLPPIATPGFVACIFGEDDDALVLSRLQAMYPGHALDRLLLLPARSFQELQQQLADLQGAIVNALIIEPLLKFVPGNEDDSATVNRMFDVLERFGVEHRSSVVSAHHVTKNAHLRSLEDPTRDSRGSSVFLDRPRGTWGLLRQADGLSMFGLATKRGRKMTAYPAQLAFQGERLLRFDANTQRHVPVDAKQRPIPDAAKNAVVAALRRLAGEGRPVTKTGPKSLYYLDAPELVGLSRVQVGKAVDALLASGEAVVEDGHVRLSDALPEAVGNGEAEAA